VQRQRIRPETTRSAGAERPSRDLLEQDRVRSKSKAGSEFGDHFLYGAFHYFGVHEPHEEITDAKFLDALLKFVTAMSCMRPIG
jgi:hypothetical protein